jgi:oligopeptide/dipeptide ABC transporter ATP-binding protein
MSSLLELHGVTKVFGGGLFSKNHTVALEDLSLTLVTDTPSITSIVGESGSGKTTLARLLLGMISPTEGHISYQGKDVAKMSRVERKAFRREVQPIFQDPFEVFNPFYKVDHVLKVPIAKFKLASSDQEERTMIGDALEMVGLRVDETLGRYPHQLSGGQRQRIMVARALLLKPKVILADEPVSMVDASLRATILESIHKLNRELGISIMYITHDLTTAYQISDNILVLYRGSVAEVGEVGEVIKDPKHPYTQLLVGSIPHPDPHRRWGDESGSVVQSGEKTASGCKFADRCEAVMDVCWTDVPKRHQIDKHRVAACHLYEKSPVMTGTDLSQVFVATPEAATTG